MGAFIEQSDGYGWVLAGGCAVGTDDKHGAYFDMGLGTATKTIYVDAHTGKPVYISKTFRVYGSENGTILFSTANFLNTYAVTDVQVTIPAAGYYDITISGYAIVAVTFVLTSDAGSGTIKLYPMLEAGY